MLFSPSFVTYGPLEFRVPYTPITDLSCEPNFLEKLSFLHTSTDWMATTSGLVPVFAATDQRHYYPPKCGHMTCRERRVRCDCCHEVLCHRPGQWCSSYSPFSFYNILCKSQKSSVVRICHIGRNVVSSVALCWQLIVANHRP